MNKQQFEHYKKEVPDFEKNHCFWVNTEDIEYDKSTSQTRALGHIINKMDQYAQLRRDKAPLPPASVVDRIGGKYELKDGCTRTGGAEIAELPVYATNYQDAVLKWGPDEWDDFQGQANDHDIASVNTKDDMAHKIAKQISGGRIKRLLGHGYAGHEQDFVEGAAKHFRYTVYSNSGRKLDWFRIRVKSCLGGEVRRFYENYSVQQAFNFYKIATNFGGSKNGDISNNQVVYTFSRTAQRNPNIIGHVATKRMDNPKVKVTLVYHVGELITKNDKGIVRERKLITDWFDKVNKHYPGWFNELYFLPQIKQGPTADANMRQLIKMR
jgi:hypothetical protein